jgi:homoserine dehydrogenase
VVCEGDFVGQTVYEGPGAGEGPTASAIVADLIDIARGARAPAFGTPAARLAAPGAAPAPLAPYYLRFELEDRPGALAEIARALGAEGVSIREMRQHDRPGGALADVLIVTHACARAGLDRALSAAAELPVSRAAPVALRIEEVRDPA